MDKLSVQQSIHATNVTLVRMHHKNACACEIKKGEKETKNKESNQKIKKG
jgi:hypothetical protein